MSEWYLSELGLDYECVNLNMRTGEHKKPDYLAINPFGKVPALVDDGLPLCPKWHGMVLAFQLHGNTVPTVGIQVRQADSC